MTQPEALRLADEMLNYWNERGPDAEAVAAELRRLHAENEALRADAERYRWLRDNHVGDAEVGAYGVVMSRSVSFAWHSPSWEAGQRMTPVTLDAAIDEARSKT